MLRRTGFKRPVYEPRPAPPARKATRTSTYAGTTAAAAPKPEVLRNAHLLSMARDQACLLQVPGVCNGDPTTTVACHSNLGEHGKAGARKADDQNSVWGCSSCHRWLDQPTGHRGPTYEEKRAAFLEALRRQMDAWRAVAGDGGRSSRDRAAALWALTHLQHGPGAQ